MKKVGFVLILAVICLAVVLNGCGNGNNELLIIRDQMDIPADKCSLMDDYLIIYETGCLHCEKVLPRLAQVEDELGMEFVEYNLAIEADYNKVTQDWEVLPQGVPAVIIGCKAYLGSGYSVEDFKQAVQATSS
ncbi:MAG: hypothetical protein JSW08_02335 [archaeon]|nr:MAG: hypothetical protein JSW08_02335 [archaeon]